MTFREKVLSREVVIGTWVQINYPTSAEIYSRLGYDFIGVDLEHSDIDTVSLAAIIRAVHNSGTVTLARVAENDNISIRRALDIGVHGVIVPMISTREDAEKAVRSAKYPPEGIRGFCFSRMNNWGIDFDEYATNANREVLVIVMIETKEGVENIDSILQVSGIDGVFIGPYDMSGSYGMPGKISDPIVKENCRSVVNACLKRRKVAGYHLVYADKKSAEELKKQGYTFICLGADVVFLTRAADEALKLFRG